MIPANGLTPWGSGLPRRYAAEKELYRPMCASSQLGIGSPCGRNRYSSYVAACGNTCRFQSNTRYVSSNTALAEAARRLGRTQPELGGGRVDNVAVGERHHPRVQEHPGGVAHCELPVFQVE